MAEGFEQTNVNLTTEDARMLDVMMRVDGYDNRSAFVRRMVRQEWARRYSKASPVTIAEAVEAGNAINPLVAETD